MNDKFTNEIDINYPSENDYIDVKVLNNNTRLLDEKKANVTDLTDVARESSPKAIENAIKNINSVVSSNLQGVARERSTYSIEDKIKSLQSEFTSFKNIGVIKKIQVLKGTIRSTNKVFRPLTLNISSVNTQKTVLIVQSFGAYHHYNSWHPNERWITVSQCLAHLSSSNTVTLSNDSILCVNSTYFEEFRADYHIQILEFY